MKKKILKIVLSSSTLMIIIFIIILVPILMVLDFFGANITDGYVENNREYADEYKDVLNKYLSKSEGYVSLERILYFYLESESLSFDEIYKDNLNKETKRLLPISEVCKMKKYKILSACSEDKITESKQVNEVQSKPFLNQ